MTLEEANQKIADYERDLSYADWADCRHCIDNDIATLNKRHPHLVWSYRRAELTILAVKLEAGWQGGTKFIHSMQVAER